MKKQYESPVFEQLEAQTDEYCQGGPSSVNDDSFINNGGEADDILG